MELSPEFVKTYFTEEKIESLFFIIIGLLSIAFAFIFWFIIKYSFYNGLAYPLLIIGIIQLAAGTSVYFRSEKDILQVENFIFQKPEFVSKKELPRMEVVMKNFTIYKWIEIALIIFGLFLFIYFYSFSSQSFWKGLGLGLLIQASLMLALDLLAEKRANIYLSELNKITEIVVNN